VYTADGVVRVVGASGGVFEADANEPSGLARYKGEDVVYSQVGGVLDRREGVHQVQVFESSLEAMGGRTEYFDASGEMVATTDGYENRVDWCRPSRYLTVAASWPVMVVGCENAPPNWFGGALVVVVMWWSLLVVWRVIHCFR
jgi:hypothetical protein